MVDAFNSKRKRWRNIRRERETWLFASAFVGVLGAGVCALVLFDRFAPKAEFTITLALAGVALAVLAPPPVRNFLWHTFANHFFVKPKQRLSAPRVLDGDTIEDVADGWRYRLANIDAPETGDNARCHRERQRGEAARDAAIHAIRAAKLVEVRRTFRIDCYGRRIAFVLVDGEDLGETLLKRGLARPWRGQRRRWCGPGGGLAKIARAGFQPHYCGACSNWRDA